MTKKVTATVGGEEFFTGKYPDPSICSYYYYTCTYCREEFQLVDPENDFKAGGAVRNIIYVIQIQMR